MHFYNDKWCIFSKDVARAYGTSFSKLISATNKIICQKKIYSTINQHNLNKPIRTKQIAKYENGYILYNDFIKHLYPFQKIYLPSSNYMFVMLYAHKYIKVINLCIQHWSWLALGGYGFMWCISYVCNVVIQIIIIIPFRKITRKGAFIWAFSCYFFNYMKTKFEIDINNDELLETTWEHVMKIKREEGDWTLLNW